jgi:hypothetical protein
MILKRQCRQRCRAMINNSNTRLTARSPRDILSRLGALM